MFKKKLVLCVIILFVATCFLPNISGMISNKTILSYEQLENRSLLAYQDKTHNDIIDSYNQWTPKPQTYSTTYKPTHYSIKPNDFIYEKNSKMTTYDGKTLYVGGIGPGNYSTIGSAVYYASDGDTVFVYSGTYYEIMESLGGITIDKSIKLIGENKDTTIIDGKKQIPNFLGPLINIYSDGVTISGFTIKNSGSYNPADTGITISSSQNNISGNIFINNYYGVLLNNWEPYYYTNYNKISNNMYIDNVMHGLVILGGEYNNVSNNVFIRQGVWLDTSYHNTFLNNIVNDKPLIFLEDKSDEVIYGDAGQVILVNCNNITIQNKDLSNTNVGIILEGTNNCLISGNSIKSDKDVGIYIEYSNNNNISMNLISDANIGMLVAASYNNIILSNTITNSYEYGICIVLSEKNKISMNTFSENWGSLALIDSINNKVSDNLFFNDGVWISNAYQNNFTNNYVNDKPLIYLEGQSDMVVDEDAGQVILLGCDNIRVQNQVISNTNPGIMLIESYNCLISNNILDTNKGYGILLLNSANNNISLNKVSNTLYGIFVAISDNNIILWNTIKSNIYTGIWFSESSNNNVIRNIFKENGGNILHDISGSIFLDRSSYNKIHQNNFLNNVKGKYFLQDKSNNWDGNFWDKPRQFPKLVIGLKFGILFNIPLFNVDWHPAKEPYDIPDKS